MNSKTYYRFFKRFADTIAICSRFNWQFLTWRTITAASALSCALYYIWPDESRSSRVPLSIHAFTLPQGLLVEDVLFETAQPPQLLSELWIRWDGNEMLSKAQADVLALWNEVSQCHIAMEKPRVTMHKDQLSIRFHLSSQVDILRFLMETAQTLSKQNPVQHRIENAEIKLTMAERGITTLLSFNCVDSNSSLRVRITIPLTIEGQPEIDVVKNGPLEDVDLSLLRVLLQSSSKTQTNGHFQEMDRFMNSWLQSRPDGDDPFEEMEERLKQLFGSFPFGQLHRGFDVEISDMPRQSQHQQLQQQDNVQKHIVEPDQLIQQLESMGAIVYRPNPTEKLQWETLSGYEEQKRRIEDGLLLPLLHPEVSESIAKRTRKHYASNRPRGVLFEGPPGTGKTTSARLIAEQASVHLIYLPLESILSKWYGESEKLLSEAFRLAENLGGSILFFDEIETLGSKRTDETHEASRRLLSLLLREMDGFDVKKKIIVIGATNRKQDVDVALLSRFDSVIRFDLPELECRKLIFRQYAQQLNTGEIEELATKTEGMSGRDIKDICEMTERSLASKIVRGEEKEGELPRMSGYQQSVDLRQNAAKQSDNQRNRPGHERKILL